MAFLTMATLTMAKRTVAMRTMAILTMAHREAERGEAHGHAMVVVGVHGGAAELRAGRARHLQGCRGAGV